MAAGKRTPVKVKVRHGNGVNVWRRPGLRTWVHQSGVRS